MLIGRCVRVIILILTILCGSTQWGKAQNQMVNGKVTFKIEHKNMTLQEAQAALTNKTAIPLKVSLVFEGDWVDLFDKGFIATFYTSHLSFGIAQKDGRDETSAPLERNDPQAYIYSRSSLGCSADDGASLAAPTQIEGCIGVNLAWEDQGCPQFAYGAQIPASSAIFKSAPYMHKSEDGTSYELDLFNIYFRLKSLATTYVRGIDYNSPAGDGLIYTDDQNDLPTTVATTMLNLKTADGVTLSWPGGPTSGNADWTLSGSTKFGQSGQSIETDYYGGVIPGGIFIEQVPELTQFERSSMA